MPLGTDLLMGVATLNITSNHAQHLKHIFVEIWVVSWMFVVVFGILAMNFLVHCVKIKKEKKTRGVLGCQLVWNYKQDMQQNLESS